QRVGAGGEQVDLALDPLEGRGVVARGGGGAMSMIAVGEPGSLQTLPDMYMRKLAVGPRARAAIDLRRPVAENIRGIAEAFGRTVNDVTTIVLDRPRHHDLIEEIRASGARIKLILDGDVTSAITAAIRGTNDHLAIGIGGTRQAVLAAAALRCLGGELQAQLWPISRKDIERAREHGIGDIERVFSIEDLALGMDIVDLGLLYDVEIEGEKVKVIHSLTSMGCPAGPMIQEDIDACVRGNFPDVEQVELELTWDPPWTPERMSDDAKFILGFG